jgi:hypothetical protein
METHRKGELAQLRVELKALEKGFIVSRPANVARYDLVIDDGEKLWRVQIKYADGKAVGTDNAVLASLGSTDRSGKAITYSVPEVDAFAVYVPRVDKVLWFTAAQACGKTKLQIKIAGKPIATSLWYDDYIW